MQTLSAKMLAHQLKDESGELLLALLKIDHADLAAPLYFVNDSEGETSGGQFYEPFGFDLILASDEEAKPPQARLAIDAVDQRVTLALSGLLAKPDITVSLAFKSTPNTIEAGPFDFKLSDAVNNTGTGVITGLLVYLDIFSEPFPAGSYGPPNFPGLFANV